ncbi:L,D-transpeptidase family protein [Dongia sedimenti]|uniref:L,D-transpeptidase family protein n=1 Tax=Dongia sedimenti TaxID=3064282 RepID=A0ABU0YKN6_9PROT|nr:L,D-transpeptidase family protein [Rhodospirillaceae bacterium R-7]
MRRATYRNAALISGAFFLAAAAHAWADSADRFPQEKPVETAVPELPAAVPAAVPEIAAAFDALQTDPATAGLKVDWSALKFYYAAHGNNALWTTSNGYTLLGQAWIVQVPRAVRAGMPMAEQTLFKIAGMTPPVDSASQTRNEALMSAVFVASAVDAVGPLGSAKLRGPAVLDKVAAAKDPGDAIGQQWPAYYRFWSLYAKLPTYVGYYQAGGWPSVPKVDKVEPGQSSSVIPAVRARLQYTGELLAPTHTDEVYDTELQAAVALFQRTHGLNDDGVIGGRTLEEMNVSAEKRLQMIVLNLDRMREQGGKFEPRHLIVNIPSQEVKVVEDGKVQFMTKAIVGKIDRKTPTLDSVIKVAKFNPEWNAPHKIASNDEVRRMRADPSFLESHGFTVYDGNGMEVDPSAIDWHSVGPGNFPYRLVQAPGPENALGPVKLDFPNKDAVYLHGTNQKQLFAKQDRYFSSGCMRMQQPIDMAAFLLADDPDYQRPRIDQIVESGKTVLVPLRTPMPVHVVYMTAWTDEDGVLQFRKDMYRYDRYADIPKDLQPGANLIAEAAEPAKPAKTESK